MTPLLTTTLPVLLVGGGPVDAAGLHRLAGRCAHLVAADGGARACLAAGLMPDLVIGDFDSIDAVTRAAIPAGRLHRIAEQDSTDFYKCLSRIDASLVLATGFAGGRMDHLLAVFNTLSGLPARRCIVVGTEDLCLLAPPELRLDVAPGTTVSLFPMGRVTGTSRGLNWPIAGLDFAPDGQIGTSNVATGPVALSLTRPRMLLLLPADCLDPVIDALAGAPGWPAA